MVFGFKNLSVACLIYVCLVSLRFGNVCGRVGFHLATDGTWFVGLHRSCIEHLSADMAPIQMFKTNLDGTKSDITPNCGEWSNIIPTQDRHVPDKSGTQT